MTDSSPVYQVKDLDGCRVVTDQGQFLGLLKDVYATGSANDVFVVRNGEKEILLPALKSVILSIDLNERTITVSPPTGLLNIYEKS